MSPDGPLRSLSVGYINPSPFKANCYLPLSNIPGGTEPSRIQTDPTHTYHIGYGKDENASALMVLVKIGHFGQRGTVDAKLERAFERYATWCKTNRKHTRISYFNKLQFKIQQHLTCAQNYTFLSLKLWGWFVQTKATPSHFPSPIEGLVHTPLVAVKATIQPSWDPGWKLSFLQHPWPQSPGCHIEHCFG